MKTTFSIIFACLALFSTAARKWSYDSSKLEGRYIAEVYTVTQIAGKSDTALLEVLSFNEQLKLVEEVKEEGLQSRKQYNPDGTVKAIEYYSYNDKTIHIKKTAFQYENGLVIVETDYELIKDKWQKADKRFTKYRFNKKGQVIQSTYSNENGAVYHDALMTYDAQVKPKQLYYYDDFDNLIFPGCVEKKVVMEKTVHHLDLYQYDRAANVVRYSMTDANKKPAYQFHYSYNDKGKLTAYDYFNGDNFDKRCVFAYLPGGLLATKKTFNDLAQKEVREILLYKYP